MNESRVGWATLRQVNAELLLPRRNFEMTKSAEVRESTDFMLFVLLGLLLFAFVGFFISWPMLWAYSWRDTTQRGILANASDWPEPIQELKTALAASDSSPISFEVYLLFGERSSTLSTVVCRVPFRDETWEIIESKLDLQPVDSEFSDRLRDQVVAKSSDSWWTPTEHDADNFASARLLAGDEADLYICSIDRTSDMIYIHYHFNF